MWQWIDQNSGALNVLANLGILAVWSFYLQLFVAGYRRERQSKILITCGGGEGTEARCFVCNMSAEPIYIVDLIATVERRDGRLAAQVTEEERDEDERPLDVTQKTKQGALKVGDMRDVGSFASLLRRLRRARGLDDGAIEDCATLELTVMAVYGPEDLPVAARRSFVLKDKGGEPAVRPAEVDTVQLRSHRERRRVRETMTEYL